MEQVKSGQVQVDEAIERLRHLPVDNLVFSRIDSHRALRTGFPEVIFCKGKAPEHIIAIVERMLEHGSDILATRCPEPVAGELLKKHPGAQYHPLSGALVIEKKKKHPQGGLILVISAGTADIPVAEEAAVTARLMGNRVEELYDVGVAGIHRLLRESPLLDRASVIVVAAGMEGALASVVGGLVDVPVIAVPTSIGYGASFGGLSALLTMLNSCSAGVMVVNIDNGFGAGYAASMINQVHKKKRANRSGGRSS